MKNLSLLGLIFTGIGLCAPLNAQEKAKEKDEDWKLRPLRYNQPDLTVDLGVGLWAWPMPMDYDGDGDMDLLVACPDKPTNGVYYFENPTQDPKVKMPVFKAAVRLGKTTHNFQVSYVNGEPRILKPGYELPRDAATGEFDFDKPEKIYPRDKVRGGKTRANMWRYVDYDGDGDQDIVVGVGDWSDYEWDHAYDAQGRWRNGPLHGYVYLITNAGSDEKPEYPERPEMLRAGGGLIDVFGWPSPNFNDFDGDGDLDLLCGEFLDGFTYFENQGTRKKPQYAAGRKMNGADGKPLVMDLQMITPTAFDWDGDKDLDLIVGDEDGRVALVENTGKLIDGQPVFLQPVYFQQQADTLKFGALATPFAYDWDGDGDEDIISGNTAGYIGIFENLGNAENGNPKWSAPQLMTTGGEPFRILAGPNGSIQGPAEAKWGYTTLSVADWDGDQEPDLLVNGIWGELLRLEGAAKVDTPLLNQQLEIAGQANPDWFWWDRASVANSTQWRTTPIAIDWNGDQSMDIVALDREGYLSLFEQKAEAPQRIFVDEDLQPLQLNQKSAGSSGRVKLAVVDWDGDGRLDVLTNSENATWYRNCKDAGDGKVVLKKVGNLADRNVAGHTSSPAVCDFDKDGKPDLLVGSENGRIYHIKHDDCINYSGEQIEARAPNKVEAPRFDGLVKEEFIYTKASFPQCHASTVVETSRGMVAAWFGGTREKDPDVGIWTSWHDGAGWSSPKEVANGIQHDGLRYPCWNPVLFQPPGDAPLFLFFKVGPNPADWWGEVMVSYDRGRSFVDRRRLPEGIHGPVRCKPMMLEDGSLLCPSSTEHDGDWRFHFERLTDLDHPELGKSWQRVEPEKQPFQVIQPTMLTLPDGRLQALFRSKNERIIESFSNDHGVTWSELKATEMPNNNSGIESLTLADGRHLLLYNHIVGDRDNGWGKRNLLHLAISEDGRQWRQVAIIEHEEKGEFSYPAMIQSEDGLVHMTYTWMRKRVKHVVVDPAKLKVGEVIGLGEWTGVEKPQKKEGEAK